VIFCVGLSKTGTTSVHEAFGLLGLRSVHYPCARRMLDGDYSALAGFDAASDIPVALRFEDLDRAFPGSRFVLTVRDEEPWLRSCAANFPTGLIRERYRGTAELEVFRRVYGVEGFDAAAFTVARRRHHERVRRHFGGTGRLLTIDVARADAWAKMTEFLGFGRMPGRFPHANRTRGSAAAPQHDVA
jgi:hypothetical protein